MQLSHLVSITPTSVHAEDYAEIVSRTATMRKLIAAASKIAELGYSDNDDLEITLRQAEDYAEIVSRTATMRKLIAAASKIAELGYSDNDDLEITLRQAEDTVYRCQKHHPAAGLPVARRWARAPRP